ncbi:MAG TPA: CBS domain-containing protein [Synergistaceae bacterium]|nr:CBS domain-containing protein [Synergistaceae bacterium]
MNLITTHIGADFDSLASMVAASKIYGGSQLAFSGSAARNVREFLRKFGGRWNVLTPSKVDASSVRLLVVVDASSPSRIGPFASLVGAPGVVVHVYDHHPPDQVEINASLAVIEPVGATTTILVEKLLEAHVPISPQEATLFAMGIYEDTGALTFGATCKRDFAAVAALWELGADMTQIPTYVELDLSAEERAFLDKLIENAREYFIGGAKVVVSLLSANGYMDGLSLFVHRLRDYFGADVALAIVTMERRTYVIVRSRESVLNAASFLAPLGGGGHPQAAAVALPRQDPEELLADLERKLRSAITPQVRVRDAMTSPVMAVSPGLSIDEAYRLMMRYGHAALPLVEGGKLVGIITRKDLDKAHMHGLGSAPVSEFMSEGVISISSNASIHEAHQLMVVHNIGRLPVVDNGKLVGILTRTDLLRALYPSSIPPEERQMGLSLPWTEGVSELMAQRLPAWVQQLLRRLGERAEDMGMQAYIVGGFVRDLLLDRQNLDLDVVIEGDAVSYAESWRRDGCDVAIHQRFRTGTITFPGGRKVDVATARREFYEYPVAQPTVLSDSLKHDLYRRDFTVNAMAICINPSMWGTLIDYFGGRRDLQKKLLKVLHNVSFVEDPSRVLRGVRLKWRLGFSMEENTLRLAKSCIKGGLLALLSGTRVRGELEIIFREENPYPVYKELADLGAWEALFPGIKLDRNVDRKTRRLAFLIKRLSGELSEEEREYLWLAYLSALLFSSSDEVQWRALDKLHLAPSERAAVRRALEDLGTAEQELGGRGFKEPAHIYNFLKGVPVSTAFLWAAATDRPRVRRRILLFFTRLRKIRPMLTGRDILEMGYREGPIVGEILKGLLTARLNGIVETREEEIEWVRRSFPLKERT